MTTSITDTGAGPGTQLPGPVTRAGSATPGGRPPVPLDKDRRQITGGAPGWLLEALSTVRDPELDEPITALGFVTSAVRSAAGDVQVRLRLPTYFCAPNFAFLMVADAYDAVATLPGVRNTEVVLEEHFASDQINGGVAAQAGFARSFDGEAVGELHDLRADFLRKAVMAGTDQVTRPLLAAGLAPTELPRLTLGDLPPSRQLDRLRQRRADLGLPAGDDALVLIDPKTGGPIDAKATELHLRKARLTRISIESNGSICRGMLQHRYDNTRGQGEGPAEGTAEGTAEEDQ